MSGASILAAAATQGLRYGLTLGPPISPLPGHISYVSYTPQVTDINPRPRTTFDEATGAPSIFPFYGQPLSLTEVLRPIGQISDVLQYTVGSLDPFTAVTPKPLANTQRPDPTNPDPFKKKGDAQFGLNGFLDNTEIRVRLLSIYCTY